MVVVRIGFCRTERVLFGHQSDLPRSAVVDLGSNSVRLVVFEGWSRNPVQVFNERAVLRLARGIQTSGKIHPQVLEQLLTVMGRYGAIARSMRAAPFEILATSAIRDAENGREFVAALQTKLPGVPIRVISGEEEAALSAAGLKCGIPDAAGILADIGGGSVEISRVRPKDTRGDAEDRHAAATLRLGTIRLADRSAGDLLRAQSITDADLATVSWLHEERGKDLYAIGGAWRALGRIHIAQTGYPLNLVDRYSISAKAAQDLTGKIVGASRRALEQLPGAPRRRIEDLPYAAVVLSRLLRLTGASRVIFSANGLREGWYMSQLDPGIRALDPMLEAGRDMAHRFARNATFPPELVNWTAPLFPDETDEERRLRETACWMSDIGSHDHPEYRGEQSFLRVLTTPSIGLGHEARAFLALTAAIRYEADIKSNYLSPARILLDPPDFSRAIVLGAALRLAYTLSAGTLDLLAQTSLSFDRTLTLHLIDGSGVFAGESISRRLERVAQALGGNSATKIQSDVQHLA